MEGDLAIGPLLSVGSWILPLLIPGRGLRFRWNPVGSLQQYIFKNISSWALESASLLVS